MDRRERQNDPEEAIQAAMDGKQAQIWTALPGIITAFDPDAMTVSVQPAIQASVGDENGAASNVSLPLLVDVPVTFQNGGGFCMTFPIKEGDEALVVFGSRCIDSWWQSGGVQAQAEIRMHDLSDGFAIIGPRSLARLIPNIATNAVQLRTEDGFNLVQIDEAGAVLAKSTSKITLDAPEIELKGALRMMSQNGGATTAQLNGSLNATGDVKAGDISLEGHTHTGVQPGSGNTGQPQ